MSNIAKIECFEIIIVATDGHVNIWIIYNYLSSSKAKYFVVIKRSNQTIVYRRYIDVRIL